MHDGWFYLSHQWSLLSSPLKAVLTPLRLKRGLENPQLAPLVWGFLDGTWGDLPMPLKEAMHPAHLAAVLDSEAPLSGWNFLRNHFEELPENVRGVLTPERFATGLKVNFGREDRVFRLYEYLHKTDPLDTRLPPLVPSNGLQRGPWLSLQ
jgi:hypothetical protein